MVYDKSSVEYSNFTKIIKAKTILTKGDIYQYLESVYESFERKLQDGYSNCINLQSINVMIAENEEGVEDEIIMCNYKCEQDAIDAIEEETGKKIISWDFEWKYHGCSGRYCRKLNCADE
jgi:hypothetical protein